MRIFLYPLQSVPGTGEPRCIVECGIGGVRDFSLEIDSGADVNMLSEPDWKILKHHYDQDEAILFDFNTKSHRVVTAYASDTPMQILASFSAWIETIEGQKPKTFAEFLVVKGGESSLLGRDSAKKMRLLKVGLEINSVSRQTETSEEFPKIPGMTVSFTIDDSVPPRRNAYYHVPAAFREKARDRIAEMLQQGIIEKVTEAPRWISGMMAVPKGKDDFRLVVNMKAPNKAILRSYFHLPTPEEFKVKLDGACYFTKMDLRNAFYHLELDEKSRELTTFLTDTGMYRLTRLVFGVNCAPELFQMAMEQILSGISGIIIFIDDILIHGKTLEKLAWTRHGRVGNQQFNVERREVRIQPNKNKFLGSRNLQGRHEH